MTTANQLVPGMIISIDGQLLQVESSKRVTAGRKSSTNIHLELRQLDSDEIIEKELKSNENVVVACLKEKVLEFLYAEEQYYLFLDIQSLDQVKVPKKVVGSEIEFLKEGGEVQANFYEEHVFSIELPSFLELMVAEIEVEEKMQLGGKEIKKIAILETKAKIPVPHFVDVGDVIKVNVKNKEFIQRI